MMADLQKFKCPMLWTKRAKPEDVKGLLSEERIQALMERKMLPICLYPFEVSKFINRMGVVDPMYPMGFIQDISIEDNMYVVSFEVPDIYLPNYKLIPHPVAHPIIMGKPDSPKDWRIVSIHVYTRGELIQNNVYNGITEDINNA